MTGLELSTRTEVDTPDGPKLVKPGSGPMKLRAHSTDYEQMFSGFSAAVRRRFIERMIDIAAAVPGRDLEELYLIDSQTDEVVCLEPFDRWSDAYNRKIRTGESAVFLWEETTSPVCPSCGQPLYWHYQSGCEYEGDISDWSRQETTQPVTLFDYSQTTPPVDAPADGQEPRKPWRVEFLSRSQDARAQAVIDVLDVFESNAGVSIEFVPSSEWDSAIEPAFVDMGSALFGHPAVSVLDSDQPEKKALHTFYGLSANALKFKSDDSSTRLETLLLTKLLCEHYGLSGIEFPHESYFQDESGFDLDLVDNILDLFSSLVAGVELHI